MIVNITSCTNLRPKDIFQVTLNEVSTATLLDGQAYNLQALIAEKNGKWIMFVHNNGTFYQENEGINHDIEISDTECNINLVNCTGMLLFFDKIRKNKVSVEKLYVLWKRVKC